MHILHIIYLLPIADFADDVCLEVLNRPIYVHGPSKGVCLVKHFEVSVLKLYQELLSVISFSLPQTINVDLDNEVKEIHQSAPYIVITGMPGDEGAQFFICGEQAVILESRSVRDAVLDLICCYFVFHITYPKPLNTVLVYLQHFENFDFVLLLSFLLLPFFLIGQFWHFSEWP